MQSTVSKEEAEAYLKEVDVSSVMTQALNAAVQAKAREPIKFFASYFRNRQQITHTQHAQSAIRTITHGIPQGSTLSTTFFLLYINDIIKTTTKSTGYTYADDTTLIITAPNQHDLQTLTQTG